MRECCRQCILKDLAHQHDTHTHTHTHTQGDLYSFLLNFIKQYFIGKHKPYVRVQRSSVITYFTCGNRVALF